MSSLRGPRCARSHIDAAVQLVRRQGLVHGEMPLEGSLLPGGSIAVVVLVTSGDDQRWVVKQVPGSRPSLLPAEAEGLLALAASGTVAVPLVRYVSGGALIMEALGAAPEDSPAFWQRLGENIASLPAAPANPRRSAPGIRQDQRWQARPAAARPRPRRAQAPGSPAGCLPGASVTVTSSGPDEAAGREALTRLHDLLDSGND